MSGMLRAGARALRTHAGLVAALYAVQLAVALLFLFGVGRTLATLFGDRPLFDAGVRGDVASLLLAFRDQRGALVALFWGGLALALGYVFLSWYLVAGLTGALVGRPFGEAAGRRFFGFARLALWSLIPYAVAGVALAVGLRGYDLDVPSAGRMVAQVLLRATPGLALLFVTALSVDYARLALVRDDRLGAGRALLRGLKVALTRGRAPLHYLLYVLAWLALSALYLALTVGHPYAGAGGALGLMLLRQALLLGRFLLRVMTTAGQAEVARAG